jgi:hypothetical protein
MPKALILAVEVNYYTEAWLTHARTACVASRLIHITQSQQLFVKIVLKYYAQFPFLSSAAKH